MSTSIQTQAPRKVSAHDDETLRDAVLQAFPSRLVDERSPILDSLVSLLRLYASNLTAEDLYYKTEAILVADKRERITQEVIDQLRTVIQQDWEHKLRSKTGSTSTNNLSSSTPAAKSKTGLGSLFGVSPQIIKTPTPNRSSTGFSHSPNNDPFINSTPKVNNTTSPTNSSTSEKIIETLNPHIPSLIGQSNSFSSSNQSRVSLAIGTNPTAWNYRYMFEKPGMKSQALDEGIENVTKIILETYSIEDEELADPSTLSQESVYVVGRVAPVVQSEQKAENDAGKQSSRSKLSDGLVLEVSRRIGAASRTPMRLLNNVKIRALPTFDGKSVPHPCVTGDQISLYPGLIAGFRGRNGAGNEFVVEEILMPPSLPLPATELVDLLEHQHSSSKLKGDPMSVFVASGPFTLDNDLNFTPWHRLLDLIEQRKPDVVLFMGPFLAVNHSALQDPDLMQLPQEVFETHIGARLKRLCESSSRTTAILLPSTRDIVHPHAAWPQPMFDKSSLAIHKRVKCLPNPCVFSINEVIFGISTADVLRDLLSDELIIDVMVEGKENESNGAIGQTQQQQKIRDPIVRSTRQIFHSQSFYPLFPASTASGLPLDVSHSHLAKLKDVTPDIVLLPSILTPFAKIVDGTVVVNPGSTVKGSQDGRGTFASLQIVPMHKQDLQDAITQDGKANDESDSVLPEPTRWQHALYDRTRVDITRI